MSKDLYMEQVENGERVDDHHEFEPDTDPKTPKLNSEFLIKKIKESGALPSGISLKKIWQKIYEAGNNG